MSAENPLLPLMAKVLTRMPHRFEAGGRVLRLEGGRTIQVSEQERRALAGVPAGEPIPEDIEFWSPYDDEDFDAEFEQPVASATQT